MAASGDWYLFIAFAVVLTLFCFKYKSSDSFESVGGIPKIVHQSWKTTSLPPIFRILRHRCQTVNKDYQFKLWTDKTNRKLIEDHYPWFLKTYDNYDVNIKRVDAARYFYLHRFGGIYLDMDMGCLKNFQTNVKGDLPTFATQFENPGKREDAIANAFMAAPPGHPLFNQIIEALPSHAHMHTHGATGSKFLGRQIKKFQQKGGKIQLLPFENVYVDEWNQNSTCHPEELEKCEKENPKATTISFWTASWFPEYGLKSKLKSRMKKTNPHPTES